MNNLHIFLNLTKREREKRGGRSEREREMTKEYDKEPEGKGQIANVFVEYAS